MSIKLDKWHKFIHLTWQANLPLLQKHKSEWKLKANKSDVEESRWTLSELPIEEVLPSTKVTCLDDKAET